MKIVIDANIPLGDAFFSTVGEVLAVPPREIAKEHLRNADALVVRSVKTIDADLLANTSVKFVGTCTAGFDHLDTKGIEALGIHWCNAPGCNANSVVEYVVSAMCALNLDWLQAKIGIVGCGNVGGLLHRRLSDLGVNCCCFDPFLTLGQNSDLGPLENIFDCDIVCLHTPYTTTGRFPSHHLFNAENLSNLKRGAVLINAGRGGVVDNLSLLDLLQQRADLRCVLDVWEQEPNLNDQLLEQVNLGTPHIAGHSIDGKMKGTAMIYSALCQYFNLQEQCRLGDLDTPPQLQDIVLGHASVNTSISEAVLSAYDIRKDSEALRQSIATTKNAAASFDQLRKNYPERREFYHYRVKLAEANSALSQTLSALGFGVN